MLRGVRITQHGPIRLLLKGPRTLFSTERRGRSIVSVEPDVPKYPWVEQVDPKGSGQKYYWNPDTNETTHLGSPRPNHWVEVRDPQGSSGVYWWNPETNETTAVGEARPGLFGSRSSVIPITNDAGIRPFHIGQSSHLDVERARQQQQLPQPTFGNTMVTYVILGAGMTFGMVAVRAIFGF